MLPCAHAVNCSIDNSGLSFDMNEDTQLVVPASAGILSKAIDISRLSIVSVQPTWRGGIVTLNMTDGSFTYVPPLNHNGYDGFSATVDVTNGASTSIGVYINIGACCATTRCNVYTTLKYHNKLLLGSGACMPTHSLRYAHHPQLHFPHNQPRSA